jgi:4-hydroxy-2-oxoheptanedioate aldolase
MTTARQHVHQKLASRQPTTCANPDYPSAALCEFLGNQGFDLIFIDCEHGGPGIERVVDMACAARAAGVAAVLRPWSKDPGLIRRYVDCRIDGLIVPDVATAADIAMVIAVMRDAGPTDPESMIMIPLIESEAGIANLSAILGVDGVQAMMMGPSDLAVSMGLGRATQHPRLKDATMGAVATARDLGKSAGGPVNRFSEEDFVEAGGNVFTYSVKDLLKRGIATSPPVLETALRRARNVG